MSIYRKNSEILNGCNYTEFKRINQNTIVYTEPHGTVVTRLHLTDIAVLHSNGNLQLRTGGWKTPTTKDRLNTVLAGSGYYITQDHGIWYITGNNDSAPFYEGITIIPGEPLRQQPDALAREKSLLKKIAKYCKAMKDLDSFPVPSGGDCWYCCMRSNDGETMGDMAQDKSHLEDHLDEVYIHGSLIVNALEAMGYGKDQLPYVWRIQDTAIHAVRRYFKSQLGLAI